VTKKLTRFESVKKDKVTGIHLDMCSHCQIMSKPEVVEAMEDHDNFLGILIDRQPKV